MGIINENFRLYLKTIMQEQKIIPQKTVNA